MIDRISIVLAPLTLLACGPEPSFHTKHGFLVFNDSSQPYTRNDVEVVIDATIESLVAHGASATLRKKIKGNAGQYVIRFVDRESGTCEVETDKTCHGFECRFNTSGWCMGAILWRYNEIRVAAWDPCIATTPLHHEMLHLAEYLLVGRVYRKHDIGWYEANCSRLDDAGVLRESVDLCRKSSPENKAQQRIIDTVCKERDYQWLTE